MYRRVRRSLVQLSDVTLRLSILGSGFLNSTVTAHILIDTEHSPVDVMDDDAAEHASERKEQEEEGDEVSMCMHVYAFVCICMLVAVLMVTVMQRHEPKKPRSPSRPPKSSSDEEAEEAEEEKVSISVCGGMHVHS